MNSKANSTKYHPAIIVFFVVLFLALGALLLYLNQGVTTVLLCGLGAAGLIVSLAQHLEKRGLIKTGLWESDKSEERLSTRFFAFVAYFICYFGFIEAFVITVTALWPHASTQYDSSLILVFILSMLASLVLDFLTRKLPERPAHS